MAFVRFTDKKGNVISNTAFDNGNEIKWIPGTKATVFCTTHNAD